MIDLERIISFYDIQDAFSAMVWYKNRGSDFLQENILTGRKSVGY